MVSVCWSWKARGDDMTVQNSNVKNIYIGNGSTTSFPFTFPCSKAEYIKVFVRKNNLIAQTDDFTVDLDNATVTYPKSGTPLAAGETLVILRELPLEQPLNLVNQGPYFAEDIETTLDEEVMMIQQLREQLGRSLTVPVDIDGETYFNTSIPIEAGKSFRVKDDGTGFEVTTDPGKVIDEANALHTQIKKDAGALLEQTKVEANKAVDAKDGAVKAKLATEAVAPAYAQTKEVLDNIVNYTNTAKAKAEEATSKAAEAGAKAEESANSANASKVSAEEAANKALEAKRYRDEASVIVTPDGLSEQVNKINDVIANNLLQEVTITPFEKKDGAYNFAGVFVTNPNYWSSEKIHLKDIVIGSKIKLKASLGDSSFSVVLFDDKGKVLDYLNTTNAVDRGFEVTSEIRPVEMIALQGAAYIVTVIRSAFYTSLDDMAVTYQKSMVGLPDSQIKADAIINAITSAGKNKFNKIACEKGYIENNGAIVTTDAYLTSERIDISNFQNKICISAGVRKVLQLYEEGTPIFNTFVDNVNPNNSLILARDINAKYLIVSLQAEKKDIFQVEDGLSHTSYEPYKKCLVEEIHPLNNNAKSYINEMLKELGKTDELKGKKWVPCGDSFTDYTDKTFASGRFIKKMMTYPRLIAERTGMEIFEDFFKSGKTMAYPADGSFTNSLTCPTSPSYYQNIPADVDYVTIMLGINDIQHKGSGVTPDGETAIGAITLGTINDKSTSTYYGAYNTVLLWLRQNRPFAHVGIIVTNGTQSKEYTEAQIALAKKWGYPYINLNGDERTPAMIRCYNTSIPEAMKEDLKRIQGVDYDGSVTGSINTHPNWQAHKYESYFIEAWLRSI